MGKKKYTTEITDAFENQIDSKEALKLAKKIKSAQALAYPSSAFKSELKDRLQNIYLIDQAEDITPRFSIFQIFGALASFVFIAGSVFMVFEVREEKTDFLQLDSSLGENTKIETLSVPIIDEDNKGTTTDEAQFIDTNATPIPENSSVLSIEESQQLTVPLQEESVGNSNLRAQPQDDDILQDDIISGDENINNEENASDILEPSPEFEGLSTSPATSSMFFESDTDVEVGNTEILEMTFSEICSEYGGELSESRVFCILPEGEICIEDNIHECAQSDDTTGAGNNIEINLEELIEEFGQ